MRLQTNVLYAGFNPGDLPNPDDDDWQKKLVYFFIMHDRLYNDHGVPIDYIPVDIDTAGYIVYGDIYPDGFMHIGFNESVVYDHKTDMIYPYDCIQYVDDQIDLLSIKHVDSDNVRDWIINNQFPYWINF